MKKISSYIARAVKSDNELDKVAQEVNQLCKEFPAYKRG